MSIIKITDSDMDVVRNAAAELRDHFGKISKIKGRALTYKVRTYGCQLNESDSEKIMGMLEDMGLEPSSGESGDLILLNTCSVRENAEDRLFGNLGEFKSDVKNDRDKILIVCGCMMKVKENVDRIRKSFPYVDLVFDPQQLHLFPVLLRDAVKKRGQLVDISAEDYIADDSLLPISRQRKFRALVPIMYGCNNFCTYCIVPYARGRERSRDMDSILREVRDLSEQGFKEVMLLGQNVNSYRENGECAFPELLRKVAEIDGIKRVRFMSSHPKDMSDDVIRLMAEYDNIETHLHLPIQSGSDRILKLMNRPYDMNEYMRKIHLFREMIPDGSISTDIIVGFPGETEEDFRKTLEAVKEAQFDSAFTFQYSPRPGTKAASMEGRIDPEVMKDRFGRLLEIQNDLAFKSNQKKIGKTEEVLIEGESSGDPDILTGRTSSFHLINFRLPEELKIKGYENKDYEGLFCDVEFTEARPYSVDGIAKTVPGDSRR